jgi:CheY-like chemotaxis protein
MEVSPGSVRCLRAFPFRTAAPWEDSMPKSYSQAIEGPSSEMSVASRVLVVDDDPAMCELIREVLSSADMEAFTLTDSRQASAHLANEKFSAVFLDVRMPPPDGIELTRQIRASGPNRRTPVVIITGEEDNAVLARSFQAGASFFLFKPIDRHSILRLIRVTEGSIQREARRYHRVKVNCNVSVECGQEQISGRTIDVSLGGMLLQVPYALPVGCAVQVTLEMRSGTPPLRVAARVVRTIGDDCMGLEIENARPEEAKKLQEFLLPVILAKTD